MFKVYETMAQKKKLAQQSSTNLDPEAFQAKQSEIVDEKDTKQKISFSEILELVVHNQGSMCFEICEPKDDSESTIKNYIQIKRK